MSKGALVAAPWVGLARLEWNMLIFLKMSYFMPKNDKIGQIKFLKISLKNLECYLLLVVALALVEEEVAVLELVPAAHQSQRKVPFSLGMQGLALALMFCYIQYLFIFKYLILKYFLISYIIL
jgi:hypothetical protein